MQSYSEDVDPSLFEGSAAPPEEKVNEGTLVDGVRVRFYLKPVMNAFKSWGGVVTDKKGNETVVEGAGRPIFDMVEYIEIMVPGDRTNSPNRPITDADRKRFKAAYQAWKLDAKAEQVAGTPLSAWPGVARHQVEELAFAKVRTVEDLASMSDAALQNFNYGQTLRRKALDFLALAKGNAPMEAVRAENEQLRARLEALEKLAVGQPQAQLPESERSKPRKG